MRTTESTDGVRVALHDLGGDGPPVLLAHATGFAAGIWAPVVARLGGYHCYGFDARHHGRTVTPAGTSASWHGVVDDLLAAIDALGLDGCAAAGHSMGAATLLLAAARRPGAFRALWCFEPVTSPADTTEELRDVSLAELTLRRRDRFPSVAAARANFAAKPPFGDFTDDSLDAYLRACWVPADDGSGDLVLACPKVAESAFYREGRHHGLFERLRGIAVPVVVSAGAPEAGAPSQFAPEVARLLPRARFEPAPHLGHFGPQQDPAGVAASIRRAWEDPPNRTERAA